MITVYGIDVMGKTQVYDWCRKFSEGRSSLDDDPRPGRKQTSSCDKNVMKVEELIRGDRTDDLKCVRSHYSLVSQRQ